MRALAAMRPSLHYRLMDAQALMASLDDLAALTDDPAVELIWPDLPVHSWLDQTVPLIQAPRVWEAGFTGKDVRIAILDTGLDAGHPDFAGRLAEYRDFVEPDAPSAGDPHDPNGHGTHVAGIAAGSGAASDGRYRGVAPGADLLVARALDSFGSGRTSQVMAAVEWAVDQGAQVINISLGGGPYPADGSDALSSMCNAAADQGVVVCVAAGNLGPARQTIGSPAAAARVITVGAADVRVPVAATAVADFSSRGPTADGRTKPEVLFPGRGIVAPRAENTALGQPEGEHYTRLNGTSQATPMATGTAALLLQANPRLSPDEIKSRLMRGAHRLAEAPANAQGAGLGDAYNTFVSSAGRPLGDDTATPVPAPGEEPPARRQEPAGCRPSIMTVSRRA
jgi:serine protease AprX